MKPMHKQLGEIGELLGLDCGDNSCLCAVRKGGMRTNGGCRCDVSGAVRELVRNLDLASAAGEAAELRIVELRAELERIRTAGHAAERRIAELCAEPPLAVEAVVALVKATRELRTRYVATVEGEWPTDATEDPCIIDIDAALKPFDA